ncbi:MAG TPA: VOC family protein [Chloroflexota bacterium]|jgi:predicted enzyme related to lactoylglutathione lyase|nr:VOC family protein [Chloroflexota bacterium]
MPITPTFGFILEYVTDVEAAKQFYEHVLGLKVERYHPTYVQFEHFAIASDESQTGTNEPEVYWIVDDASAALAELSAHADVVMPLTDKPYGKVFAIRDPAGRPRYIVQWARERPSQAV